MAAVAMTPNPVRALQEEAVCAICLDYFTDPVSIGCGHNFCRVCVTQLWGGEDEDDGDELDLEEEEVEQEGEQQQQQQEQQEEEGERQQQEEQQQHQEEEEEGEQQQQQQEEEEEVAAGADGEWNSSSPVRDEDYEGDLEEEGQEDVPWTQDMGGSNRDIIDYVWEEDEDEDEVEGEELEPVTPPSPPPSSRRCFTCPQCRKSFPRRSFRPNLQLANMVQVIRQMHPTTGLGSHANEQGICPKHQEALKLFCEVDEEAICVVCRESRSHKQHSLVPLEEVVQQYKDKLQGYVEPLRKHLEAVQKMKAKEERRMTELRNQMESELEAVASEFGRLIGFLAKEQAGLERHLREMREAQLLHVEAVANRLTEQAAQLSRLLEDAQERSQQGGLQLLQDLKETFNRCEDIQLQPPEILSPDPCEPYRHDFLTDAIVRKMSRMFSQAARVDLTLDPGTAHPSLMLSPDRRGVCLPKLWQEVADHPELFSADCCVLGTQSFCSGRHYWEVEVVGRRGWAVGVIRESIHNKEKVGSKESSVGSGDASSSGHPHCRRRLYLPQQPLFQREVWCVGTDGKHYQPQSSMQQTLLSPNEKPRRFGVYLDYEAGRLGFYNVETLAHVHTFSAAFLGEPVYPFFRVLSKGTSIKLCP